MQRSRKRICKNKTHNESLLLLAPSEIILCVIDFLDIVSMTKVRETCTRLRYLVDSNKQYIDIKTEYEKNAVARELHHDRTEKTTSCSKL